MNAALWWSAFGISWSHWGARCSGASCGNQVSSTDTLHSWQYCICLNNTNWPKMGTYQYTLLQTVVPSSTWGLPQHCTSSSTTYYELINWIRSGKTPKYAFLGNSNDKHWKTCVSMLLCFYILRLTPAELFDFPLLSQICFILFMLIRIICECNLYQGVLTWYVSP